MTDPATEPTASSTSNASDDRSPEALAWADRLSAAARRRSRWFARFLLAFAVVTLAAVAIPGVVGGMWAGVLLAVVFVGFGAVTVRARHGAEATQTFPRRPAAIIAVWTVLYLTVVSVGVLRFPSNPAWWLPGAAVAALPLFVGAYLEARRQPARKDEQ